MPHLSLSAAQNLYKNADRYLQETDPVNRTSRALLVDRISRARIDRNVGRMQTMLHVQAVAKFDDVVLPKVTLL